MDVAIFGGRLVLAAVFAVAGLAKLRDPAGTRSSALEFGLPARLARPLALLLPAVELLVAAALLPSSTARAAAVVAGALLAVFSAGIALSLARGRRPDCHCFGRLHPGAIGATTLARNGLLMALAALVAWRGGTAPALSGPDGLSGAQAVGLVLGAALVTAVVVEGWVIVQLLRQHGRLLLRVDALEAASGAGAGPAAAAPRGGLPVGAEAPEFALPGLDGGPRTLASLRDGGRPVLLVFSAPGCGPCEALMPEVGQWQRDPAAGLRVAVVSTGNPDAVAAIAAEHGLADVLRQEDHEVAERYAYLGTPSAVVVAPGGRIASALVAGPDAVRALHHEWRAGGPSKPDGRPPATGHEQRVAPPRPRPAGVGDRIPALRLPGLDGTEHDLAALVREPTLVLFWSPGCGFCADMLDDLRAWEARPPAGAPSLVVVSTGPVEVNRALGVRAPVLLDISGAAMAAFGASGTPMAVLVEDGKIASPVAAGAAGVFDLAGGRPTRTGAAGDGEGLRRG